MAIKSSCVVQVCVVAVVLAVVNCHFVPQDETARELSQEVSKERMLADKLLHHMMDVAYEMFRELGGSEKELKEVQRKRSIITRCYFQAITCY